jgi:hypothetical protein
MAVNSVIPGMSARTETVFVTSKTNLPLPQFKAGETLTVNVIEKIAADSYLVSAKNVTFRATSSVLLNAGDQIRVRVQSVQPQIVFNVLDATPQQTAAKINGQLLQWRVNPDSFVQLLARLSEFSSLLKTTGLPGFPPKEADVLLAIFGGLIFSSRTKNNSMFVKDFLSRFGFLPESDSAAAATGSSIRPSEDFPEDNLKALLLKLEAALQEARQGKQGRQEAARLAALSSFVAGALGSIEGRQAASIAYQQNESGLYLQVPLALGHVLRQADIFIFPDDKNVRGENKFSSCRVVIFIDMDILGHIAVDVSLKAGRMNCLIQCETEKSAQLIGEAAQKLKDALCAIGYAVDRLDCFKATGLTRKKMEYIDEILISSAGIVNDFV